MQSAVYQYEGSLNKFLMDDKGSTLLAVWGLPPLAHDDDPVRAVMSSLLIAHALAEQGFVASIGVSTGVAFCGLVGNRVRREYSVLGDMVNLSARLMQYVSGSIRLSILAKRLGFPLPYFAFELMFLLFHCQGMQGRLAVALSVSNGPCSLLFQEVFTSNTCRQSP